MPPTRRDALWTLAAASFAGFAPPAAAAPRGGLVPIVTSGAPRLYPAWPVSGGPAPWWTAVPLINGTWTLPQLGGAPVPTYVSGALSSLGASHDAGSPGALQFVANTPLHGAFTRAYCQWATPPVLADGRLEGTISAAFHCLQWHRRINGRLALQVVVHAADGTARGIALPVTADTLPFTVGTPATTRAAVQWPLQPVALRAGDVIAVNVGIAADNQTRTLAQGVGFHLYGRSDPALPDIGEIDSATLGRSWIEFSAPPLFSV